METKDSITTLPSFGMIMSTGEVQRILNDACDLDITAKKMLEEKIPLLQRLKPNELTKLIQEVKKTRFKMATDYDTTILDMVYQARIKSIEQYWEAQLTALSVTLNKELITYANQKYLELLASLKEFYRKANKELSDMSEEINNIKYPPLKARYQKTVDKMIDDTWDAFENLCNKFINALKEKKINIKSAS